MRNRSRSDINTMILEAARDGATRTKIMYKAYLSYSQVVEYLAFLQERELIRCEEGTQLYRVTEKGLKFMNVSDELNDMMVLTNSKNYLNA